MTNNSFISVNLNGKLQYCSLIISSLQLILLSPPPIPFFEILQYNPLALISSVSANLETYCKCGVVNPIKSPILQVSNSSNSLFVNRFSFFPNYCAPVVFIFGYLKENFIYLWWKGMKVINDKETIMNSIPTKMHWCKGEWCVSLLFLYNYSISWITFKWIWINIFNLKIQYPTSERERAGRVRFIKPIINANNKKST